MPAVVLLTEPGWVDRTIYDSYLSQKLADNGFTAERSDIVKRHQLEQEHQRKRAASARLVREFWVALKERSAA